MAGVLPNAATLVHGVMNEREQPSLTYKLDLEKGRIVGMVDGREAVEQAIRKALITERFACTIYNNQYGSELAELIGGNIKLKGYLESEIRRCVKDALSIDTRILAVTGFAFSYHDEGIYVSFDATTIFGDVHISEMEVKQRV